MINVTTTTTTTTVITIISQYDSLHYVVLTTIKIKA